ncbi:hypothetical protein BV898_15092 [Hypsibius exemplaris]|uniref:Uncharacterized protein n=1 Tax=Hypsibius exemplaris TaxID=2072580 RepID=A0A9X6ND86_HYPEX|nr:hypothetical protein BV898_15092 [Hypsibius exemplaris]
MATLSPVMPYQVAAPVPVRTGRNIRGSRVLAVIQLVCGIILALLEIIGLGMGLSYMDIMTLTGAGLWSGAVFITTGILGILATRPNPRNVSRKGLFGGFLGMSVFSSVLSAGMIIFCSISFVFGSSMYYSALYYNNYNSYNSYNSYYSYNSFYYWDAFLGIRIFSLFIYSGQCAVVYHVHGGQPQPQNKVLWTTASAAHDAPTGTCQLCQRARNASPFAAVSTSPQSYAPDMQQHFNDTSKRGG